MSKESVDNLFLNMNDGTGKSGSVSNNDDNDYRFSKLDTYINWNNVVVAHSDKKENSKEAETICNLINGNLLSQLSRESSGSRMSLDYYTKSEVEEVKIWKEANLLNKVKISFVEVFKEVKENIGDILESREYYNYAKDSGVGDKSLVISVKKIKEVFNNVRASFGFGPKRESNELNKSNPYQEERKMAVGENYNNYNHETIINKNKDGKDMVNINLNANVQTNIDSNKSHYRSYETRERRDYESERLSLDNSLKSQSVRIASNFWGEINKDTSNNYSVRFGTKGSKVLNIAGPSAGMWYDFEKGVGGNMYKLVMEEKNLDFKGAYEYLMDFTGVGKRVIREVSNDNIDTKIAKTVKEDLNSDKIKQDQEKKIAKIVDLYNRSRNLRNGSVASAYLRDIRGIELGSKESGNQMSSDIREGSIYAKNGDLYPAIMGFGRDKEGEIKSMQVIYLDSVTHNKAKLDVNKRSYGIVAGSNVLIGEFAIPNEGSDLSVSGKEKIVTIIGEGIETSLSIRDAISCVYDSLKDGEKLAKENGKENDNIKIRVLSSLGIGNMKNYVPDIGERVIFAIDNDGANSRSLSIAEKACNAIEKNGGIAMVMVPDLEGDYNDLVKGKIRIEKEKQLENIGGLFKKQIDEIVSLDLEKYLTEKLLDRLNDVGIGKEISDDSKLISQVKLGMSVASIDIYRRVSEEIGRDSSGLKAEIKDIVKYEISAKIASNISEFEKEDSKDDININTNQERKLEIGGKSYEANLSGRDAYLRDLGKSVEIRELISDDSLLRKLDRAVRFGEMEKLHVSDINRRLEEKYLGMNGKEVIELAYDVGFDEKKNFAKDLVARLDASYIGRIDRNLNQGQSEISFKDIYSAIYGAYENKRWMGNFYEELNGKNHDERQIVVKTLDPLLENLEKKLEIMDHCMEDDKKRLMIDEMVKEINLKGGFKDNIEMVDKYFKDYMKIIVEERVLDGKEFGKDIENMETRIETNNIKEHGLILELVTGGLNVNLRFFRF